MKRRLLLLPLLLACSEQDHPAGSVPPDAAATSPDASPARGPCDPVGTWRLGYRAAPDQAIDTEERVQVEKKDGRFVVTFPGRTVPDNQCSPGGPTPGTLKISGDVSSDGCTLTAGREERYCLSGEDQCEHLAVTLVIAADGTTASGSGTRCRCWNPAPSCSDRPIAMVHATRESP